MPKVHNEWVKTKDRRGCEGEGVGEGRHTALSQEGFPMQAGWPLSFLHPELEAPLQPAKNGAPPGGGLDGWVFAPRAPDLEGAKI